MYILNVNYSVLKADLTSVKATEENQERYYFLVPKDGLQFSRESKSLVNCPEIRSDSLDRRLRRGVNCNLDIPIV